MATKRATKWGQRPLAIALSLTMITTLGVVARPEVAQAATPEEQAISDGIEQLMAALGGLDNLDELGQPLPLTELLPTGDDGLDLAATLIDAIADLGGGFSNGALEAHLESLSGTTAGGVVVDVDADVSGDVVMFATLTFTRSVSSPIDFFEDGVDLGGGAIGGSLTLDMSGLVVELDDSGVAPELFLPMPNTIGHVTADLDVDFGSGVDIRLGILDVTVTGTASADVDFTIDLVDPDSDGRLSLDELAAAASIDLFNIQYASSGAAMNASLAVAGGTLLAGSGLTGTVVYVDTDLSDDAVDTLDVNLPELRDFTNMGAPEILVSIAQLAVSLQAMQTRVANPNLPMLGAPAPAPGETLDKTVENLADLIDVNAAIGDFFVTKGLARPESPFELLIGDTDGDGVPDVDLETLGLATLDGIMAELETALGDAADLAYADGAITFDLAFGASYTPPPAEVKLNDQLAELGLSGLVSANGSAGIGVVADYDVDVTFGIDLADFDIADPITDFLFIDTAGTEITGNALASADLALGGTIGFLEVALTDQNPAAGAAGWVPILGKRAGDSTDMVTIDLASDGDKLTLTELYQGLANLDTDLVNGNQFVIDGGPALSVTGTINAAVPATTLTAVATIGSTDLVGAEVTFGWEDILDEAPTLSGNANFNEDLLSFNIDPDNPLALFNQIVDAVDVAIGAVATIDEGGVVDEELPIIGTSLRDSVSFLDDVRDTVNELAQDPAGSLQRFETELELAIASAFGVDISAIGDAPDPNDADFIDDNDTPLDLSDDFFDDDVFQAALDQYIADVAAFLAANDYVQLEYVAGSGPGTILLTLNLGVCSDVATYAGVGCTQEIPLMSEFNFDTSGFGDLAGLIAAEGEGTVELDYNASVTVGLGVELPDVFNGDVTPKPFVADSSGVDLRVAGVFDGAFNASIGPFEVEVGAVTAAVEDCANDTDDDGDGAVNDGCVQVGDTADPDCSNALDDDPDDDDDSDGTDDGTPSVVNDGCPDVPTTVQAKAGAAFTVAGDVTGDRAYLVPEVGEPGVDDLFASIDLGTALGTNDVVDCGDGVRYACASLPLRVNAGGAPIYLGTIQLDVTELSPFDATVGPPGILDDIKANLLANAETLAWQLIGQGLQDFGDFIEESTDGASYDVDIPVVGDVLDGGAAIGAAFNDSFATPVGTFLQSFDPTDVDSVAGPLQDEMYDLIGPDGAGLLLDTQGPAGVDPDDIVVIVLCGNDAHVCASPADGVLDIVDLSLQFSIGETIAEAPEIPFDFGFPGLRLATADGPDADEDPDGITASVDWSIDVGFGLSLTEGFYLSTGGTDEISLDVSVNTPDFMADIAFLGVNIDGDNSDTPKPVGREADELNLSIAIDLPDPSGTGKLALSNLLNVDPIDLLPTISANVDIYWRLATAPEFGGSEAGDGSLPTVYATLDIQWGATLGVDGLNFGDLDMSFEDVELDLGSFINDFLAPILDEVTKFTKPLQPIIDVVSAPIPGISQLAELVGEEPVTMIDLFEAISGNDLTLIKTLLDVVTFINAVAALGDAGEIIIPIGRFDISGETIGDTELPANQKRKLISGQSDPSSIMDAMGGLDSSFDAFVASFNQNLADGDEFSDDEPGFTFPAFEDLSNIFNLLVGEDITLVRFASGPLKAEFGFSQSFGPIAVGPIPVSIVISGSASIEGRFAVGYDTKGVRQLVQAITSDDGPDVSFLQGFGFLFNGLFLDDLNSAGQDVPEIRLVVEFAAGAAVDLVIISAGVEGGVRATLDLNLHDGGFFNPIPPENLDGKLRLDEIASFIFNNPICLFDVSGKLEAFVRIFVEIDLFLFSKRFQFTVVNITLLELENITAELCEPPEPVLSERDADGVLHLNIGTKAGDRGFAETEPDEKFIVRQLDDDSVLVSAFGFEEERHGVTKVIGDASGGNDTVRFEPGSIESVIMVGDEEKVVSQQVPFVIPTVICGGAGDDKLFGGEGPDRLGGDGSLVMESGEWTCSTGESGGDGLDQISANGGIDTVWGHGESDQLGGGSGNDIIDAGGGDDQVDGDLGADRIDGGPGADNLKGGADANPSTFDIDPTTPNVIDLPPPGFSDDIINGGPDDDTIEGDWGDDTINGDGGDDIIVGGFGNDTIDGGPDQDIIYGDDGDDPMLRGGTGDDSIFGMDGDDTIEGDEGDDNLMGNDGDDDIGGGPGLDIILGDNGTINRAPLQGNLLPTDPAAPLVTTIPSAGAAGDTDLDGDGDDDIIYGQAGADTMNGGGGNDLMFGDNGIDTMSGDAGADTMFGDNDADVMFGDNAAAANACADGADMMRGGPGADLMSGNGAGDTMFGDSGEDTVYGDAAVANEPCDGVDVIRGLADGDDIWGNGKGDDIQGDGGNDQIVGGNREAGVADGTDFISGNADADVIAGDNAIITGGANPDTDTWLVQLRVDGLGALDVIGGDAGDDRIYGQAGNDALDGDAGNDSIEGNSGADLINGGTGDDDLVGGSSAFDGVNDDGRNGDDRLDDGDTIHGNDGADSIAGDNAWISRNVPSSAPALIVLFDVGTTSSTPTPGTSGPDTIFGDAQDDQIFGQAASDTIDGNDGDDYIEGNDGNDSLSGNDGDDDIVGGGSANDGVIDADRLGTGLSDVGETLISGGSGVDYIAGDNALLSRVVPSGAPALVVLFDIETVTLGALPGTGGPETLIDGGPGDDLIFGQTGNDNIDGGLDDDYVEGNNGADDIDGGIGDDDLVGGGSASDGVIDDHRDGTSLLDDGDVIRGGSDEDWIAGDNALINRSVPALDRAGVELFDVEVYDYVSSMSLTSPQTGGADTITGDGAPDRIFGQTDGDDLSGGGGADYVEGNNGIDTIDGGGGDDDLIGGGSATDGVIDGERRGHRLLDQGENIVTGGVGDDWITGDNALINRNLPAVNGPNGSQRAPIELFDVQTITGSAIAGEVSGGDVLHGDEDDDRIFGQGNGFQDADQADPDDGLDNDFDGRESASSTEYDCADDFDNDGDGATDAAESGCSGAIDEDTAWDGDIMFGGSGDDAMEGNHGADWMFGDEGEDDMIGGGSANDGVIDDNRNPVGLLDRSDVMSGGADDDVMTGDNARIDRVAAGGSFARLDSDDLLSPAAAGYGPVDQAVRLTNMFPGDAGAAAHGDDHMTGDDGNDEMYGQLGDDFVLGSAGDDALIGDLGQVQVDLVGDSAADPAPATIVSNSPRWEAAVNQVGSLRWDTELYAADTSAGGVGGNDVLLGYDGRDVAFGGPGNDVINGDGDGVEETLDPTQSEFSHITDIDATTVDDDVLFGGDDADAIWGGRGNDVEYGGWGDDHLDVRPRDEPDNGRKGKQLEIYPRDRPAWFTYAFPENFQDVDFMYGGWDRDAHQADQAANGPDPGDRMADWAGGFNVFYVCPAGYGDFTITRSGAPAIRAFLQELAEANGAIDAATEGSSGFRDIAYVFTNQRGQNSHPPHPDHAAHFTCADFGNVVP